MTQTFLINFDERLASENGNLGGIWLGCLGFAEGPYGPHESSPSKFHRIWSYQTSETPDFIKFLGNIFPLKSVSFFLCPQPRTCCVSVFPNFRSSYIFPSQKLRIFIFEIETWKHTRRNKMRYVRPKINSISVVCDPGNKSDALFSRRYLMGFAHCRRPPCCWFLDVCFLVIFSLLKCVLARWFLDVSFQVTSFRHDGKL